MTTRTERLKTLLQPLQPIRLEIIDDSARHAGHAAVHGVEGGETHFRIEIASPAFAGKSRLERHRMVQELVKVEFDTGLHALQIRASDI